MTSNERDAWQSRTWDEVKVETQARADRGAYPIFGVSSDDAREALSKIGSFDRDAWGAGWMSVGDRRLAVAVAAESGSDMATARREYLAAWRLYLFGRWPVPDSPKTIESYQKAKHAFEAYGQIADPVITTVVIPFEGKEIVGYLQLPKAVNPPVVISIGGSDLGKDNVAIQTRPFLAAGIASFAVDMPGAGDAPVPCAPGSERMISAIIDYVKTRADLDGSRIIVRGQSWGSYWSARTAYAEADRISGAVFQSGPVHAYFQREFQQDAFKTKEFLFDYVPSRLHMLGQKSVEDAFAFMPSLSLVTAGLIDKPTPPMLIITGAKDTQVPFSDFELLLTHGSPKFAWVNPTGQTMGRSVSVKDDDIIRDVVVPWIRQQFGI